MKLFLACIFLATSFAMAGPKYAYEDPHLDDEMENNYKEHSYPNWVYARGSSATISYVNITSGSVTGKINISSAAITTANITNEVVFASTITNLTVTNLVASGLSGKFKQIVSSASVRSFGTTSTTYQASGITVTITPTAATSSIYCVASFGCTTSNITADYCLAQMYRAGSPLNINSDNRKQIALVNPTGTLNMTTFNVPYMITQYDSPNTTSATVYEIYIKNTAGAATVSVNIYTESDIACFEIGV